MADSKIFKYANNISYNRNTNSARSITTGGYARTHRLGPSLYNISADLPILTETQYNEVEGELFEMEDGIQFLNANISSNNGNNIMSSTTIPLQSGQNSIKIIKQDYSRLNQFTLCNIVPNTVDVFKVGDFIQFDNSDKVYQIYKPVGQTGTTFTSSNSGTVRVRLSSPIISNLGLATSSSRGRSNTYYIASGTADTSEQVSYNWVTQTSGTQVGKIIFKDATTGIQHTYADGTAAELNIWNNYYYTNEIRAIADNGIAGTDTNSSLTQEQRDQNNKLGQILNDVSSSGNSTNGTIIWDFFIPNLRVELTVPSANSQSMTNETVLSTIVNQYQTGLLTIKNSDNTTAKDSAGNDLTISLPASLFDAEDIYNYLLNTIMATNSTHPIKTLGVWTSISSNNFFEYWSEPQLDHVGTFTVNWGVEYDGCYIEFTTNVGTVPISYNKYESLNDKVSNLITNGIEIENSVHTYAAGEYLQPSWLLPSTSYTKKILSVSVSGTTTTINFDTTFSSGTSGWYDTGNSTGFVRHENGSNSTTTNDLIVLKTTSDAQFYKSSANVLVGPDVNMKLMLNEKPNVTIIPRNEKENLYKYDTFNFLEVL
jgi:hypothetical protein